MNGCSALTAKLLDRLAAVKETGANRWLARCPAHADRSPSLSIREVDDGRILLHCFAACKVESILAAVGLTFADIMPERIGTEHSYKPTSSRIPARDALATLEHESLIVALIGGDFLKRRSIDEETWTRLAAAVQRIGATRSQCEFSR